MRSSRLLALVALGAALSTCSKPPTPTAKHLLLISVDTLRADRLGCHGGPNRPSPAIDRLASEGVRFSNAYVPRGMTLPSMTTFFTSKYPADHGVYDNEHQVSHAEWMLAERLADSGFRRLAVNSSDILDPARKNQIDQGYGEKAYIPTRGDDRKAARLASEFLRKEFGKGPKREYLWVHFMSPHKNYEPPREIVERFDPGYSGKYDGPSYDFNNRIDDTYIQKLDLSPADRKHVLAIYDGEVNVVDDCVKELLAALDASGAAADTLVVFVADHGEELFTHQTYPYHGNSPYRSVTHIPFIARQPGKIPAGRTVDDVIESVDFLPTVVEWLGLPGMKHADTPSNELRGRDLSPLLRGDGAVPAVRAFGRIDDCAEPWESIGIATLRDPQWSLVVNRDGFCPAYPPETGSYEVPALALYDLTQDPDEQNDVAAAHPDVVKDMVSEIEARVKRLRFQTADKIEKTAEDKAVLTQQGYLGAGTEIFKRRRCAK